MEGVTKKMFGCKLCPKSYEREHQLKMHLYSHDDKPYSCSNCSVKFSTLKGSLEHEKNKICQKILQCRICSKELKSLTKLKFHQERHKKC